MQEQDLTRSEKVATWEISKIVTSDERINAAREYIAAHPGTIKASMPWSDYLCLRIETLKDIGAELV